MKTHRDYFFTFNNETWKTSELYKRKNKKTYNFRLCRNPIWFLQKFFKNLDYTEMAVKEFQNDKTLKVTGKVDEKTARKLGII